MPRITLVCVDPEKTRALLQRQKDQGQEQRKAVAARVRAANPHLTDTDVQRLTGVDETPVPAPEAGWLYLGEPMYVECPMGGTNCADCGDPAHAETCRAAGHCAGCGTRHGVAPRSHLAAVGLQVLDVAEGEDPSTLAPTERVTRSRGR